MIYAEFWGLTFPPFANDSHPETFIPTRSATMVMARLRYALGLGMGASALYGEPGSGKSRVARMILAEFTSARWAVGYLPSPFGSIRDILNVLEPAAAAVGNDSNGFYELGAMLAARAAKHQPTLLAVDDIQAARGTEFLEAIRTLLNVEHGGMRALSVLLIGQPGMERRLAAASGFDGQLIARTILEPMSDDETRLYILAKLKAAGSRQGIFTKQAAERVVKLCRGFPRQVNRLCEMSLVVAYGLESERVSPDIVEMAASDLDLLPEGEATFFPWPHPEPEAAIEEAPEDDDILASLA